MDHDILNEINNIDLSKVETSFPVLKSGVVKATIAEIEFDKKDKKDGSGVNRLAKIKYSLGQPWETQPHDGLPAKPIAPGFPVTETIYLDPFKDEKTGEEKNLGIARLALLRESVLGKAKEGDRFDIAQLIGREVILKLKFDPAPKNKKTGEVYGPQTTVDGYVRQAGK